MKTKHLLQTAAFALALAFSLQPSALVFAAPLGTAFTYQGRLNNGGNPATGFYDLRFAIYDALTGPSQIGAALTNTATAVTNGLFTVTLDFGSDVFTGEARWLEIAVRTNGSGSFSTLTPRQSLTPSPYALYAPNAGAATTATTATTATSVSGTVAASQLSGTISSNNIGAGSITATMLAAGSVTSSKLAAGAVTTSTIQDGALTAAKVAVTTAVTLLTTFTNPTPANSDWFGFALAGVGTDRVLIGAYQDDTGAYDAGAAYLFDLAGNLITTFTNPTPEWYDNFGYSVAAVGTNRVLIAAYCDNTGAPLAGAAYLLDLTGNLITTFTNPTPVSSDLFGNAVAAVGTDRVLIGAYLADIGANNAGVTYLFSTNGTLLTTFTNPTPVASDFFGNAVAAVGMDRVLIGAYMADTGATDAGAAYLFSTNGALLTTFTNPIPAGSGRFGGALAAVGTDRVLIGANLADTGATDTGAAYLFSTNGTLLTTFTNPTPAASDCFGYSVAAVGLDKVLIGAHYDDTGASDAGAAYLFSTNGTLLTTLTNPIPAGSGRFGNAVAAVGTDKVLIGAYLADTGANDAGAAYLFSVESYTPGLVAQGVHRGAITADSIAAGAVGNAQLASNLTVSGSLAAGSFSGNGAGLTSISLSSLPSGVVTNHQTGVTLGGTFNAVNGLTIENRTSDPPSPAVGQIWLRTDL